MKQITLADVAQVANVSVFTVSQAVNGRDGLADSTRAQVLRVANELGYIPNRAAQQMRRSDRSQIAVLTGSSSNAYYTDMMRGVTKMVVAHNRTVLTMDIAAEGVYTTETEDAVVRELIRTQVSGVISTLALRPQSLALFEKWHVPVVFVDSAPAELTYRVGFFGTENVEASLKVGRHLHEQGMRDWLFVAYPKTWSTREPRQQGLTEAADAYGARLQVIESANNPSVARKVTAQYLSGLATLPDALIAGNNPILQGVLTALNDLGLRVPEDIGVIAYDEFPWGALMVPSITVINEHSEDIGEAAARCLMRVIDEQKKADRKGRSVEPVFTEEDHALMPTTLVVRHSCGEAKQQE